MRERAPCFLRSYYSLALLYVFEIIKVGAIMKKADTLLSNRLELQKSILDNHHISLFGENITWKTGSISFSARATQEQKEMKYNYIDNFFLKTTLDHGILYTILILSFFSYTLFILTKEKKNLAVVFIEIFMVYALLEPDLLNISRNFSFLALAIVFNNQPFLSFGKKQNRSRKTPKSPNVYEIFMLK